MTYRHRARGSIYDLTDFAILQTDEPLRDHEQLVLYRAREDGTIWARPTGEFFDRERFEKLTEPPMVGNQATKVTGYPFPGEIRSVFWTRNDQRRFVVEATGADYAGMLHIFNATQLGLEDIDY